MPLKKYSAARNIPAIPKPLQDFRGFLTLVWRHLALPDPTPIQLDIAHFLQTGPRRRVIEAFRGVGKSWITSAYVVWRLLINPDYKVMVVSASKDRADNFTTFTLRLINEIPELMHLKPGVDQRCSKISFDVGPAKPDHSPSVSSKGIFSQLAGARADEIVSDDVEVPNNSLTQIMREKLGEAIKEFDAILKPGGTITYLGTPQTEQSIYNLLPDRGYTVRIWPARYPTAEQCSVMADKLAPFITGRLSANQALVGLSTDPRRFSDEDLAEREMSYGRSGFALQFMLDTRLSDMDRYPLRLKDLLVMNMSQEMAPEKMVWAPAPDHVINELPCVGMNGDKYHRPRWTSETWLPYTGSVMAIDPSGKGTDETAFAVVKMLNGYLFVTRAGGIKGGYEEDTLRKLARIAKEQKVNQVIIEENFGGGMFAQLLTPYLVQEWPCSVDEVRHSIQKEKRIIDTLEPVMNQHRLVIDEAIIREDFESCKQYPQDVQMRYQLFYQMSRITRERGALVKDDRLDALAIAVAYWVEQMAQDADTKVQERKDKLLEQGLMAFANTANITSMEIVFGDHKAVWTGLKVSSFTGGDMETHKGKSSIFLRNN